MKPTPGRYLVRHGEDSRSAAIGGDGRVFLDDDTSLDVERTGPGQYRVSDGQRMWRAFVAGPPDGRSVFLDGEVYDVQVAPEGTLRARSAAGHGDTLTAPMPATVTRIRVTVGQAVTRGETVLTLEAMKMEMPVRASRDGSVKAIHCAEGQLVLPGAPLVELM